MLRFLVRVVEFGLLGLIGYNLIIALFGWKNPGPAPEGTRQRRFRVVVPAHNEEAVIGNVLSDLAAQTHSSFAIVVLADHCSDQTASVAAGVGTTVVERTEGPGGKGAALAWYLEGWPLDDEALVVVDADNRVPSNLLTRFSDELDAGNHALQAYLGISNPDASALATASALSYWASNRMVQLARRNLDWTADLGGTGMCLTAEALRSVGGFGTTLAEDQELGVRLFEAGYPVVWLHDVDVLDEKPTSPAVAVRQRSRWASGRSEVARKSAGRLFRQGSLPAFDLGLRLVQPSRMGIAIASAGMVGASVLGAPTLGVTAWGAATAVQVFAPIPFLWRDGVEARYLVKYPLLTLLPVLKLPARLMRQRGWYHTPHSG